VDAVLNDWKTAPIDDRLRAACGLVEKLTLEPQDFTARDIAPLRSVGLGDETIEDVIQVCALFNMYDRIADSLGFALLVVLDTLTPAERIAFVLHDVFALPFDEIAPIVERSPDATRQLASRARRRVRLAPQPDRDLAQQRRAVAAFLAAARSGDFEALLTVLDPEVVFRADLGPSAPGSRPPIRGARAVATEVLASAPRYIARVRAAIVNGAAGAVFGDLDHPLGVIGFTVVDGRIVAIDLVADPAKLPRS